jgi:hypothetical protein
MTDMAKEREPVFSNCIANTPEKNIFVWDNIKLPSLVVP